MHNFPDSISHIPTSKSILPSNLQVVDALKWIRTFDVKCAVTCYCDKSILLLQKQVYIYYKEFYLEDMWNYYSRDKRKIMRSSSLLYCSVGQHLNTSFINDCLFSPVYFILIYIYIYIYILSSTKRVFRSITTLQSC